MQTIRTGVIIGSVIIMSGMGVIIGISMWPYLNLIGQVATMFTIVIFGCAGFLAIAATRQLVGIMAARRRRDSLYSRVIVSGDVVAVVDHNGQVTSHLSALHEAAKVPLQIAAPEEKEEPEVDIELILEMKRKGSTLMNIAKATGASYYYVQRVCSEAKKNK
jgi:hypothetical protein